MFKFYSQLVGTKYLFFTLGRVITEINTVAAQATSKQNNESESGPSLLTINMEVIIRKIWNYGCLYIYTPSLFDVCYHMHQ
jgi:hypothetical protein